MSGGLNRLLAVAAVAGAVLFAPATALASGCTGGPSAESVYSECVQTAGGSKPTTEHSNPGSTQLPISKRVARALAKHGGSNRSLLSRLVRDPSYGASGTMETRGSGPATAPSALGSAFDLGSGPTALLAVLAGTAALLLGASGFRVWRHRHHS